MMKYEYLLSEVGSDQINCSCRAKNVKEAKKLFLRMLSYKNYTTKRYVVYKSLSKELRKGRW